MNWSAVSGLVAKAAPVVGTLLGGPAGAAAGAMVAKALGVENDSKAVERALRADPAAMERLQRLEMENQAELNRLLIQSETARLTEINKTMRVEASSEDAYVRRWRPSFGYLVGISWFIQMFGFVVILGIVVVKDADDVPMVIGAISQMISALIPVWGVALTVLGVGVAKRSGDKQVAAGKPPTPGVLSAVVGRIMGK